MRIESRDSTLSVSVPIVCLLGGPGSGKGTQCEKLVKKYGFTHISTGDLIRDEVKAKTDIGLRVKELMDSGLLVDSSTMIEILRRKIQASLSSTSSGFLLDGFPRSEEQAHLFKSRIGSCSRIIVLSASDEIMVERLLSRGRTSGRSDDNEKVIRRRLETFHRETEPILSTFSDLAVVVPAESTVDEVFQKVDSAVRGLFPTPQVRGIF